MVDEQNDKQNDRDRDAVDALLDGLHAPVTPQPKPQPTPEPTPGQVSGTGDKEMDEETLDAQSDIPDDADSSASVDTTSVTLESLTFSDGTTIYLDPADVVVLVGPNNAGKSAALRELEQAFESRHQSVVLQSCKTRKTGEKQDFASFVKKHARIRSQENSWTLSGYQWELTIRKLDLQKYWPDDLAQFRSMFCLKMPTETRITGSNPPEAINIREESLSHPIHILLDDDELEVKISKHFRKAFHEDLILDRNPARTVALLVGTRPVRNSQRGEDRLSKSYRDRVHDSTIPLVQQGDGMRSFASVILHLLAPISASVLLLDEPEAFLHPPQARLLGEIIATEKSSRAQLFVATHSPDVLQGLVRVASDRLRLLRMQRKGDVNRIRELDKELVKEISSDPLMNYSLVMSGVFHERVIICEADGDCMFYRSILDLDEVHGGDHPDVLFVHASGKDRMATLAGTLRALDVRVDVIADIDVLRDESGLQKIVTALEGDWSGIQPVAKAVRTAVDNSKPGLGVNQIKQGIQEALAQELPDSEPVKQLRLRINAIFQRVSPWDAAKRYGEPAIPKGQATEQFEELKELCKEAGLWIVPVGEMEGFCRSIGGKGPRWVQEVIKDKNLATDTDLEQARKFMRELWESSQ